MIFTFRRAYIQPVAPSVAREPKIISSGSPAPIFTRLDSTQPRVSPGMAAGVNSANEQYFFVLHSILLLSFVFRRRRPVAVAWSGFCELTVVL